MDAALTVNGLQVGQERLAVLVEFLTGPFAKGFQQIADGLLPLLAGFDFLLAEFLVLFGARGKVPEAGHLIQHGDTFAGCLEVQPERAFDGDLVEAEVLVVENLADDQRFLHPVHRERPCFPVREPSVYLCNLADMVGVALVGVADAVAFVAETLLHLHPEVAGVNELNLSLALPLLSVREHPDIGGNSGVVEELVRQRDNRLQPVVLNDPAADFRFALTGVAGEQGRAIEDDADATAPLFRGTALIEHVLKEEQRPVVDAWQTGPEAAFVTECVAFLLDVLLLLLPLHAEGRIGQHIVEGPFFAGAVPRKPVLGKGVAPGNVVCVFAFDEHVGLADRPRLVIPVLAVHHRTGLGVQPADVLLGHGKHTAGAASRVVDRLHHVTAGKVLLRRQQQVHHELDNLARREMLPGLLVRLLRADPNQLLEDVAHLDVVNLLHAKVYLRKRLDDLIKQVLFGHARDLLIEREPFHDVADVLGETVDVAVKVGGEVIRVIQQGMLGVLVELHLR